MTNGLIAGIVLTLVGMAWIFLIANNPGVKRPLSTDWLFFTVLGFFIHIYGVVSLMSRALRY